MVFFVLLLVQGLITNIFCGEQNELRDGGAILRQISFVDPTEDLSVLIKDILDKEETTPDPSLADKELFQTLDDDQDGPVTSKVFHQQGFLPQEWPFSWGPPPFHPTATPVVTVTTQPPRPVYGVIADYQGQNATTPVGLNAQQTLSFLGATTFANLLEKAEIKDAILTKGSFTIFAPTEFAFGKLINQDPQEYNNVLLKDKKLLTQILLQHVVQRKLGLADLIPGDRIQTLARNRIEISDVGGIRFGGAKIIPKMSNRVFGKGLIHFIDNVIYPVVSINETKPGKNPIKIKPVILKPQLDESTLIIHGPFGIVRGIFLRQEIRAWLGIPYAKPPIGSLRFSKPEPIDPWVSIMDATRLPNACMQTVDEIFGNFTGSIQWNPNTEISEDCLYLNVYAPLTIHEPLPVLVWIYGGGFSTGSSSLPKYDPTVLIRTGNIIFVSMQYRLGAHGFLHLGNRTNVPGNVGLLDQVLALRWIQNNIESFGGDPSQVTLMGEDAGAASITLHMMSGLSTDLFHRAILQSTGIVPRWGFVSKKESIYRAEKFCEKIGCEFNLEDLESTSECLRRRTSEEILLAESKLSENSLNLFPFVPTVDGTFLKEDPNVLFEKGKMKNISVIIGNNANEGFRSLMYLMPDLFPNFELTLAERSITDDDYKKAVAQIFYFQPKLFQKLIAYEYRRKFSGPDRFFKALDLMVADSEYVCNTERLAQKLSQQGNKVFRYLYNHRSSIDTWPSWSGSKHGDEIEFVFGRPLKNPKSYSPDEATFSEDLISLWINFVKSGSPNPSTFQTMWPEYANPNWKFLKLSADYQGHEVYRLLSEQCLFWRELVPEFLPPKYGKNIEQKNCPRN